MSSDEDASVEAAVSAEERPQPETDSNIAIIKGKRTFFMSHALLILFIKYGMQRTFRSLICFFPRVNDEIHGSILDQIDQIIEVIHLKYMKAKITYEGLRRIERYFVPDAALREALLNALCHKKYESGVPLPRLRIGSSR